jgi:hypothetical protein
MSANIPSSSKICKPPGQVQFRVERISAARPNGRQRQFIPAAEAAHRCIAAVPKARTTISVDERVLRAVRVKAARTGRRDSEVIEDALRRDLGLDLLERVWESADLDEDEALRLGVEAQHEARRA